VTKFGVAIVDRLLVSQFLTLYTTPIVYADLDHLDGWLTPSFQGRRERGLSSPAHCGVFGMLGEMTLCWSGACPEAPRPQ
jgi:hypothetical protein